MIGAPVALRERPRRRAVVAVGVGAHDRSDRPAADRRLQRFEMLGQVRTGIDHRHFRRPEQIGLGAEISERRRIVREHARRCPGSSCSSLA